MKHILAVAFSVVLILSSPFAGQVRTMVRDAFPGRFFGVVATAIGLAVAGAVALAVARIRAQRARRYGAVACAIAIAATYALARASGNGDVDIVEDVHFVQYGLLALLFYRAWRARGDLTVVAIPLLAGATVATMDEWLQWFVPARVGEMRDVGLDMVAISCGLFFAIGVAPPLTLRTRLDGPSARQLGAIFTLFIVVAVPAFVAVHVGHRVRIQSNGMFLSRYSAEQLRIEAVARTERWRDAPPVTLDHLSREDQYLAEGIWHVTARNLAATAGDHLTAWKENLILEEFFAPVLDTPSYVTRVPSRWSLEQRRHVAGGVVRDASPFVSRANPFPIVVWGGA